MILQGILDRSLGNFICLRGFASLGDLYQISAPDPSYQRTLITHQQERMEKFLDDAEYLFFPEVILGTSLDAGDKADIVDDFVNNFSTGKAAKYDFSQFKINYSVNVKKSKNDSRSSILLRHAKLDINDVLIDVGGLDKFHRIDGNHRLSILNGDLEKKLTEEKRLKYSQLMVPYCVVLFNEDEDLNRYSRALFHNVNYRQISLTMEQSLKQILDDTTLFPNDTLTNKFGQEYLLARLVKQHWDIDMIPNIAQVLEDNEKKKSTIRTFLLKTFQLLTHKKLISIKEDDFVKEVKSFKSKLSKIENIYTQPKLGQQHNSGLLSAFVYYAYVSSSKLNVFKNWVLENHIYQTQDTQAAEIIKIFDCVLEAKSKTIFVSMQFCEATKGNYQAIKDAIENINNNYKQEFNVREIRIDQFTKGHSFKIDDELLKLIRDSGLLLADISLGNKNVYHEIGYLMGLNEEANKLQDNFILFHNKGVEGANFDNDHGFNIKTYQVLLAEQENDLRAKIEQQIIKYYQLEL